MAACIGRSGNTCKEIGLRLRVASRTVEAQPRVDTSSIDKDITALMSEPHQRPSSLHS